MKRTSLKRILALALTVVMVFALAATAMAEPEISTYATDVATGNPVPPYQITIKPNSNTLTPGMPNAPTTLGARFQAYAIFTGVLTTDPDYGYNPGENNGYTDGKTSNTAFQLNQLSAIDWGTGSINVVNFVKALIGDTTPVTVKGTLNEDVSTTVGALFTTALTGYTEDGDGDTKLYTSADAAKAVAKVLSDNNENTTLVATFAKLAAQNKGTATATSRWDSTNNVWHIGDSSTPNAEDTDLETAGYYLVIDTYTATAEYDEISLNMIGVGGDQTINIKSNAATVTKDIITGPTTTDKKDSAGVSDTVSFRLTGTLAENYIAYTPNFAYRFVDKLSAGFTYVQDSIKVYVEIGTDKYLVETGFTTTPAAGTAGAGGDSVEVTFSNLKAVVSGKKLTDGTPADEGEAIVIDKDTKIIVEYDAVVNSSTVVGFPTITDTETRNNNTVYLTYNNDVYDQSSIGRTAQQAVYTYSYGITITKLDGAKEPDDNKLAGAGFALTKTESGVTYYAVLDSNNKLKGWYTEAQLILAGAKDSTGNFNPTGTLGKDNEDLPTIDLTGCKLVITTTTTTVSVSGLDAGTYTLSEVVVPSGFQKMDDITFTITPTLDGTTHALTALAGATVGTAREDVTWAAGVVETGLIPVTLVNYPEGFLPGTGGIGTTLFYVAGVLMLAGAAVFLFVSRRKNGEQA